MTGSLMRRFLNYVKHNTASDPLGKTAPSSPGQKEFALKLSEELKTIGLSDVEADSNGYVTATIPANIPEDIPVVGFIAHMDTSPDFSGENVKPQIFEKYDGGKIILNSEENLVIDPSEFPELLNYKGQTLITTDGTTLLGADDKAGVAEIVTASEILLNSPHIQHGKIRICFTPDEEIGQGAKFFDLNKFGVSFAFTVDGGEIGELEFENFNAACATITILGKAVHPGEAKGKMVNALLVAHRLTEMLPAKERPENTEGYEGFFHLTKLSGNIRKAEMEYLIRDHNQEKFRQRKELLIEIAGQINSEYPYQPVTVEITDQYYNMRSRIEPSMYIVDLAKDAMHAAGISPKVIPVRGGTDGAVLSWMGLPCPNIFTGGHNFHGPYEFIPVESMVKAVEVILNICQKVPIIKNKP